VRILLIEAVCELAWAADSAFTCQLADAHSSVTRAGTMAGVLHPVWRGELAENNTPAWMPPCSGGGQAANETASLCACGL
jgi:hypothetical protein